MSTIQGDAGCLPFTVVKLEAAEWSTNLERDLNLTVSWYFPMSAAADDDDAAADDDDPCVSETIETRYSNHRHISYHLRSCLPS